MSNPFLDSYRTSGSYGAPTVLQNPNDQPNKMDWITRNLNSIGGGGGAVAGGLTGAAIGSVVPVVGTGIGGVLGALIGGAGGGLLGEAGKQAAQGKNATLSNPEVQKQALIQGALGAGGEIGGQLVGRGISALLGKAAGKGAEIAANPVESILQQGAKTSARLSDLTPYEAQRIIDTAPESAKLLTGLGVNTPEKMAQAADLTTGKTGYLNSFVRRFIDAGGPVDVTKAQNAADTALSNLTDPVAKREVQKNITDVLSKLRLSDNPVSGDILSKAQPGNVFDAIQNLDEHMAASESKPAMSAYRAVKGTLESALYKEGGANAVAAGYKLAPDEAAQILADAKAQGLPKVGQHIIDTVNNAQDISTLRSAQSPFVNAGKAGLAYTRGVAGTTGVANNLRNSRTIFQGMNAPVRAFAQSGSFNTLGRMAGQGIAVPANLAATALDATGSTLGRAAAQATIRAPELQGEPAQASVEPQAQVTNQPSDALTPGVPTQGMNVNGMDINGMINEALSAPDAKTQTAKLGLIGQLLDIQSKANPVNKPAASAVSKASDIQDAFSTLDTAAQQLKELGGAEGPISGRVADLPLVGQYLNSKGAAYNQTKVDLATALAKAITGSARPAASVIKQYENSLPALTDNPQKAAQKLANIRTQLQNKASNYLDVNPDLGQYLN